MGFWIRAKSPGFFDPKLFSPKKQFYDIFFGPRRAIIFPCQYFPCRAVPIFFRAMIFRAGPCHKSAGPPFRAVPGRPCNRQPCLLSFLGGHQQVVDLGCSYMPHGHGLYIPHQGWIAARAACGTAQENGETNNLFVHFFRPMGKLLEMASKRVSKFLFPTTPDLANIWDRKGLYFDFDNFYVLYCFVFQISRFPDFQIHTIWRIFSRFPDFQIPKAWEI